ncbi:Cys-tRNA(Pro) deacylase [Catenovulum sp. SM1970]|uniref:Cys-tRNA(Pro) deacylase n=1 Tax=Marinifaba aquimaris TaxID=2741323 RepID=UPI001571AD47|nr:Cys-tRNA(Pro) deacylase [Marinifaba aquimaris]NTS76814.1 Cys-tRNA(Pro) deacylase [Marinifaba aquimaris]
MTPAINSAKKAKITFNVHEYQHDPAAESYGLEASTKLSIEPARVFKTLVVNLTPDELAVGIIPVDTQLSMKAIAKAAGAKKAVMAAQQDVERATGYVLGGVSPLGQKKRLKTFIDNTATHYSTIYVSAGRRGLEIELNANDLSKLVNGVFAALVS